MLNISPYWKSTVFLTLTTPPVSFQLLHPTPSFPLSFVLGVVCCLPLSPPPTPVSSFPTRPGVPQLTDLTFQDVSDTSISLTWSPFNTTAVTGYRITVTAAGESVPIFEDFVLPTTGQYTVHGLEPGIDYDISVITVSENGESEPTTITQQTCKTHVSNQKKDYLCYINIWMYLYFTAGKPIPL